jgi:predicted metal-dependent HD superfamily phosphohydrolase
VAASDEAEQIPSAARWQRVCEGIGLADATREHSRLVRAWSTRGRHYHTLQHLAACLLEFDGARGLAQKAGEVELALWFHDAVYRTYRKDNELRSAEWAAEFLSGRGAAADAVARVRGHVLATPHASVELEGDAALAVDIDLSILGRPPAVYDEFERNVRKEYWWVPRRRFAAARRAILQSFLDRPSIYHWPHFREHYEVDARANLARALAALPDE